MLKHRWKSVAKTDIGTVRKVNEDGFLDMPTVGLWCVADGMGGHAKGDVASGLIVDNLQSAADRHDFPLSIQLVQQELAEVNRQLVDMADEKQAVIGSTVVVLVFDQEYAHCIWAGDSRIYRLRNNKLQRLTRDHSQVEEMVQQGLLSPEEAEHHPNANVITRAVGAGDELELDIVSERRQEADKYFLCSDGLNKVMSDTEIESILSSQPLESIPAFLINTALERKARDNVTVLVVDDKRASSEYDLADSSSYTASHILDDTLPLSR